MTVQNWQNNNNSNDNKSPKKEKKHLSKIFFSRLHPRHRPRARRPGTRRARAQSVSPPRTPCRTACTRRSEGFWVRCPAAPCAAGWAPRLGRPACRGSGRTVRPTDTGGRTWGDRRSLQKLSPRRRRRPSPSPGTLRSKKNVNGS